MCPRPEVRVRIPGAQDPPYCRLADPVTEAGQPALHPAVSPGRILPRQPQHQLADLLADPRAARPVRVRPRARDQAAVPGQQRAWRDEPACPPRRWQPGQRGQDRPVGPVRLRPGDRTPEHRYLMTEHHDLRVLSLLAAAQQNQPAEHPDHDQVQQSGRHEPRSCRNLLILPNRRSRPSRRVLERYRDCASLHPEESFSRSMTA
jgi:hypothetical protein